MNQTAQPARTAAMAAPSGTPARPPRRDTSETPVTLTLEGSRAILRHLMRVTSAAFLSGAVALWALPGASFAADMLLIKLALTLVLCGISAAFWLAGRSGDLPVVRFDPIRREVSILRPNGKGHKVAIMHRAYETFAMAQIAEGQITLWDHNKVLVLQVPVPDRVARAALRRQFSAILMRG